METIRRIESRIALNTAKQVEAFMQELKAYELLVTSSDMNSGLSPIEDSPPYILHRPFVDERYPARDIREFAWAIGLDAKMHAIYIDLLSIGDITRTMVTPWSVFRGTFHYPASSIILVHNHPSGDPTPSPADLTFTEMVIDGSFKLQRGLEDHVILGDDCYHGMLEQGQLPKLEKKVKKEIIGVKKLSKELLESEENEKKLSRELLEAEKALTEQASYIKQLEAKLKGG